MIISDFQYGQITSVGDDSIPDAASSGSLNWVTESTKIALRGGYGRLGTTDNAVGPITGLKVAKNVGLNETTSTVFRKRGLTLEYYDTVTSDWIEVGTNIFPAGSENAHVSMENYHSITGSQLHINGPQVGPFKVMVANPGSYVSLYDSTKNFYGYIRIKQNRTFLWSRGGTTKDTTGLYGSYLDKDEAGDFTQIADEAIGAAGSTNYTGTLAFKAAGAKRTCFEVTFTDGTETFTDNLDGTLTGTAGGTGTINYTTGEYDITFNAVAGGAVTATYRWEDSTATGITDFTKSTPRTAGQGFVFRQDDGGGKFMAINAIGGTEYCLHETKTWALTLSDDDTAATNLIYRDRVGVPNFRASVESGDGVYYMDDTDENDPHLRLLSFDMGGSEVIPKSVSKRLKLNNEKIGFSFSGYVFDACAMIEWGDYIVFACRTKDSAVNNRVFTYNKQTGAIDEHDYFVSCFEVYEGTLIAGDSISGNVTMLFNGLDDDGSTIANYWEGALTDLTIPRLKKQKKLVIQGEIGKEQSIKVSCAIDRGAFVEIGTIYGNGTYVDTTNRVVIGSQTIGSGTIGGDSSGIEAYNYMREFSMPVGNFEKIKLRFEALGLGYASVSTIVHKDLREKWARIPTKYRAPTITNPEYLTATALEGLFVSLTWNSSAGDVAGYQIERCSGTTCTNFTQVDMSTGTNYTDSGLVVSTLYRYRVRAFSTAGKMSTYSNIAEATAIPDTTVPTKVTDLSVIATTSSSITIQWTEYDNVGVASFDVRYSTVPVTALNWSSRTQATGEPTPISNGTVHTFEVTGLSGSTKYYFGVKVTDSAGNESGVSNVVSDTTL